MVECEHCHGSGVDPTSMTGGLRAMVGEECPVCEGTGQALPACHEAIKEFNNAYRRDERPPADKRYARATRLLFELVLELVDDEAEARPSKEDFLKAVGTVEIVDEPVADYLVDVLNELGVLSVAVDILKRGKNSSAG